MNLLDNPRIHTLIQHHRKELMDGITKRTEQLKNTPKKEERELIQKQLEHWSGELEIFDTELADHVALVEKPLLTDSECSRVDIVVLKYKDPEAEEKCILNLVKNTQWPHKITWYDSRNQSANFAKLWSHLIKVSTCDYVLIMDSDAYVIEDGWLTKMMTSFQPEFACRANDRTHTKIYPKNVGMVVPVTHKDGAHTIQGKHRRLFDPDPFIGNTQVSGFFFLLKKKMFEDIGAFDPDFYLHGQDSEWIDRILSAGYDIIVRGDVFVDHGVSTSISAATKRGEFNYDNDIAWTQIIYQKIRDEKREGVYEVPR